MSARPGTAPIKRKTTGREAEEKDIAEDTKMFAIESESGACIKVVGCGGAGGNAINNMVDAGVKGVEFVACNTDMQALHANLAHQKLQIGQGITGGLGAGANPEIGWKAAMESQSEIQSAIGGADMVFVTAGLGGGTGTGAAPVVAQAAKDAGILSVGVVTMPFGFEGKKRMSNAEAGLDHLYDSVDTLIIIPNDRLVDLAHENMPLLEAFQRADGVLQAAVRGISEIIVTGGLINVDFADVKTIMTDGGMALMGLGTASGEGRALTAAEAAINSPLLDEVTIEGATGVLVNVTGGQDLALREVDEAVRYIQEQAHPDANIIFGAVIDMTSRDEVQVTVIATGGVEAKAPFIDEVEQPEEQLEPVAEVVRQEARRVLPTFTSLQRPPRAREQRVTRTTRPMAQPPSAEPPPAQPPPAAFPQTPTGSHLTGVLDKPGEVHTSPPESEYESPAYIRRRTTDIHRIPGFDEDLENRN